MKRLLPLLFLLLCAARSYDGSGDSHVVNNLNKGSTSWSVCMWVYASSWTDFQSLVAYGNGPGSSAGRGWQIVTLSTGALRIQDYVGGATVENDSTSATMSAAAFHHVCVTQSGTAVKFYFDSTGGTASSTLSLDSPAVQNSTDDLIVGQTVPSDNIGWFDLNAQVSQVAYWDTALTGAQVASMADKSTCPSAVATSNLQAFLKLSEATVVDSSANAFSVTQNGNPALVSDPSGLPCGGGGSGGGKLNLIEDY